MPVPLVRRGRRPLSPKAREQSRGVAHAWPQAYLPPDGSTIRFVIRSSLQWENAQPLTWETSTAITVAFRRYLKLSQERSMKRTIVRAMTVSSFALVVMLGAALKAQTQDAKARDPTMPPLDQYLMPDVNSEIALARSAAPASIANGAEVMVLRRKGYTTAVKGTNGFLCVVERSWGAATDEPDFWNPKVRAAICFNSPAARTFAPIFLMKTKLVLAGKSKTAIVEATASALDKKELPALEPGAMCYMMSKQQYLSDHDMSWHPHLMFLFRATRRKAGERICRACRLWRRMTLKNG